VDFTNCRLPLPQTFAQGFDGHVETDLVAEFEAVRHRLCGGIDADRYPFDAMLLASFRECRSGEADHTKPLPIRARRAAPGRKRDPDLSRILCSDLMKHKRGQQADRRMRKPLADLRKRMMFGHGGVCEPVETSSRALQHAAPHQTQQVFARDARRFDVARANDAEALGKGSDSGFR